MSDFQFLFISCQIGAERALKLELARRWPEFRFAYSRAGFLTFKLPDQHQLAEDFDLRSVFARTYGFSLGQVEGKQADSLAARLWQLAGPGPFQHLHVWQRDPGSPGEHGFEPGTTPLAAEIGNLIASQRPAGPDAQASLPVNQPARPGQRVLDCIIVEPDQWWAGVHRAASTPSRWPGGIAPVEAPPGCISRAYLKMAEALAWSRLPVAAGDRCVEIGSAPGGACQALLDRGLHVTGIDPADMDPSLLQHPHFTHVKKRAADMKRREFRGVKWLMADSNVAPNHTLDTVEAIVTHREIHIRGLLLTLKLLNWDLAQQIPDYLARVRSWGYHYVAARQLAYNKQEICVAAMPQRSTRRQPRRSQRTQTSRNNLRHMSP